MSSDEFWKDDPQLFVSYRTSFINKKKREAEELDYKCWLQGLYIHDGNGKLFSSLKQLIVNLVASFSKAPKNKDEIGTYPSVPYSQEKEVKKEQKLDKHEQYQNSLLYFGSIKQIYLQKLKKKSKGE